MLIYFLGLAAAGAFFIFVILLSAVIASPRGKTLDDKYDSDYIASVQKFRRPFIDLDNPPVFYRSVDYAEGPLARWYPKGQSPILKELADAGLLPSVKDRVGPEPLVVEGVEGIGKYGGTWHRLTTDAAMTEMGYRLSYVTLVRWSSQGYPIVPHLAKNYEISDDNRQFIFHLRKGVKWSDGRPFTADDIMFWWNHIANDKTVMADVPVIMKVRGVPGSIEKIDDYTIRFCFPSPNGIFLAKLASDGSMDNMVNCPAHYLSRYHPSIGDRDLINRMLDARKMQSDTILFRTMLVSILDYPDKPTLWPWIYRKYRASPP